MTVRRWTSAAIALGAIGSLVLGMLVLATGFSSGANAAGLQETVLVNAAARSGASSVASLEAGKSYTFEVSGTYAYGRIGSGVGAADAECGTLPPDQTYQRNRFALLDPGGDLLDLYVNGGNVEWEADNPDVFGCATDHVYSYTFTPAVTAPVNFAVHERGYADNNGGFTVKISEIVETQIETLRLFSNARNGAVSVNSLSPEKLYRVEISGTYTFAGPVAGVNAAIHDAECLSSGGLPGSRDATTATTPTVVGDDPLDVLVNNAFQDWVPTVASKLGCNDVDHTYTTNFRPSITAPVKFKVSDTNFADNAGIFDIRIVEIADVVGSSGALPLPKVSLNEEVAVDSSKKAGANSTVPVQSGESYLLEASGTYAYGGGTADAECSTSKTDPNLLPDRYAAVAPSTDLLDILVNTEAVEWVPTEGNADGCNGTDHTYRYQFVAPATGTVNFRVADANASDNSGILKVRIYRIDEIPLGTTTVAANNSGGANTIPLVAGQSYRFNSSGTYTYAFQSGAEADTECSRSNTDPLFIPNRYPTSGQDVLDLYVNNAPVTWSPANTGVGFCDTEHQYNLNLQPVAAGPVNLIVKDSGYRDNTGGLTVALFLKA